MPPAVGSDDPPRLINRHAKAAGTVYDTTKLGPFREPVLPLNNQIHQIRASTTARKSSTQNQRL
ncbi:hypothetical protein BJY01DRAFT_214791, partial [Aspergillus pseudoustus]